MSIRAHRCAAVFVVGAMFGGVLAGCGDDSDDASPVETVADLQGTWSNEDTWADEYPRYGPTTLTLTDCAAGEECGRLERIDDNLEQRVYALVYRSEDADGFNFETGPGNSFGRGYSPWANGVMHLTPGTDGTVEVVARGVEQTATTLRRAED